MKDEWRMFLTELAGHPVSYGLAAAAARWAIGDRAGGLRALGTYLLTSLVVAWGVSLYLGDELMSSGRKGAYTLLFAFAAKDLLTAVVGMGSQFRDNPIELLVRVRNAFFGVAKP